MKKQQRHKQAFQAGLILMLAASVSGGLPPTTPELSPIAEVNAALLQVAAALGILIITYAGIQWVIASGPQERDDAKKTIIYVVIGLVVVSIAEELVNALYTSNIAL